MNRMTVAAFELAPSAVGGEQPTAGWIPALVPGGVHESLLAVDAIPHPYADRNEADVRWIEERDWWYRTTLTLPSVADDERLLLVFHGLDTVVDLWIDGEPLGHHENMFRPAEFDLSAREPGDHELILRFSPPLSGLEAPSSALQMFAGLAGAFSELAPSGADAEEGAADAEGPQEQEGTGLMSETLPVATLRRKATFSWGWDFGPRVPSVGIWLPVELVLEKSAAITGHHVRVDAIDEDGTATVMLDIEVDAFATTAELTAAVTMTAPSGAVHRTELPVGGGRASGSLTIVGAELWWTHDLGTPALYDVHVEVHDGARTIDELDDRIGLRTISIDRSPDPEGGRYFRFLLNGRPLFARGAAWLPPSMLVGSVSDRHLRASVELARDGGMNMLRIWGGGIYEHDAFYRACDEQGVMVWQDFAFACIDYPSEDEALADEVAREAEFQVRRLRNRASMAVWSGNNEVQLIHGFAYRNYEPGNWGYGFFHRLLPEVVARLDGAVPYWPGSPWGEDDAEGWMAVNGVLDGDRHAWEVWHGFDFGAGGGPFESVGEARHYRRYALDRGKFISEFGIHASPERATLERWIPEEGLAVHSPSFDAHNKDNPKNKHDPVLEIVTGLPHTLDEYVDMTMVSQAEGLKFGIEHYRRRQPHCSGTLIWQFNDVWPGFSWSLVDYDLVPKAGYYAARRAFAPLLASFRTDGDRLELWLSNAGRATRTSVEVSVRTFSGETVIADTVDASLAQGESRRVWSADGVAGAERFGWVQGEGIPSNRILFSEVKDVPWGTPVLERTVERTGAHAASLTLRTQGYAFFVHVVSPAPGVRFSDNYLDIPPGGTVRIDVDRLPEGFDPEDLEVRTYIGQESGTR